MSHKDVLNALKARRAVELTKGLVRAPSINPPGNEKAASDVVSSFFDQIGIKYMKQSVSGDRCNVIATLKGRTGGSHSLLLTGHLDVVPPGDEGLWTRDPFCGDEVDGQIYGRGSTDAKGCLGAMLCAIEAIAESGIELLGDLYFAAVVGEETDGMGIKHLVKSGLRPDMALVGEPTQLRVNNAHKGIARLRIDVSGKAAHASLPDNGANAISGMAKVILGLDDLATRLRGKGVTSHPSLVVSTISGGIKDNVVPPNCSITVDRRLVIGERPEGAEDEIIGVVRSALGDTPLRADVEPYLLAPPAQTSSDELIVRSARASVGEVLGEDMGAHIFEAYCDMGPLVDLAGTKAIILGPGSLAGSHIPNEVVSISEVEGAAKIYSLLAIHVLCP